MTSKCIRQTHDELIQDMRDFIYNACSANGVENNNPENDECPYYSLKKDIVIERRGMGLSSLDMPWITEIRAYIGEGWIYVKLDSEDDFIDLDELSTDDQLCIVEALD